MSPEEIEALAWLKERNAYIQFSGGGLLAYVVVGTVSSRTFNRSFIEAYRAVRKEIEATGGPTASALVEPKSVWCKADKHDECGVACSCDCHKSDNCK